MANSYFRFKQFIVHQEHCAMKVCTDACILGAVTNASTAKNLLDIGTGTGLLSLMMAQRFPGLQIDAIEIDTKAAEQAKANFAESQWNARLTITTGNIKDLSKFKKYDHIICNPPFYDGYLKPDDKNNSIARHSEQLTLDDLSKVVESLLSPTGKLSVLLPPEGLMDLEAILLAKKMILNKQLLIKDRNELPVIRVVGEFSFNNIPLTSSTLVIKKDKENYTDDFKSLLQHFYLAF